jgi:hypothetical protein
MKAVENELLLFQRKRILTDHSLKTGQRQGDVDKETSCVDVVMGCQLHIRMRVQRSTTSMAEGGVLAWEWVRAVISGQVRLRLKRPSRQRLQVPD